MKLTHEALKDLIHESNMQRQELIRRCRSGDRQAFTQFIQTYQDTIFSHLCHTLGSKRKAAVVTRNVFVHAYRSFAECQDEASLKVWLFKIAEQQSHAVQRRQHWGWVNRFRLFAKEGQLDGDQGRSEHIDQTEHGVQDDLLLAYIDGELSESEAKRVEQRLAEDTGYRQEYEELQQLDMLLRCGSQISTPVDLHVQINAQLDTYLFWNSIRVVIKRFRETISVSRLFTHPRFAAVVATVMVVFCGVFAYQYQQIHLQSLRIQELEQVLQHSGSGYRAGTVVQDMLEERFVILTGEIKPQELSLEDVQHISRLTGEPDNTRFLFLSGTFEELGNQIVERITSLGWRVQGDVVEQRESFTIRTISVEIPDMSLSHLIRFLQQLQTSPDESPSSEELRPTHIEIYILGNR